ncbi:4-alpha-glucanotransferase [Gaiella sp.]|uniref:4-alpha-glucanotransferase n=1 Tax=Gaiella sp. TaxID=2663207 RepID=UPI00326393E5
MVAPARESGVLLHITSLPSGRLDEDAYRFVDWLVAAGQSWWQVLPLHIPDRHGSPYASRSAFAGHEGLLAPRGTRFYDSGEGNDGEPEGEWLEEWVRFAGEPERRVQIRFQREWLSLKRYANDCGIRLIGDIPLYVAGDSCDAVTHPDLFDRSFVAGAAPSPNHPEGQRWGMPVFDWPTHAADGFSWWLERLERELELCDRLRIDHFRGLAQFWQLALDEPDPVNGSWGTGPGEAFFEAIRNRFGGLPLIVEDLGLITPDVIALREEIGVPGMNVVARVADIDWRTDSVLYTSTHDSETLAGWWERWGRENQPQLAAGATSTDGEYRALLQNILAVENELVIIAAQDLLGLGNEARMNRPGTVNGGNWKWKLEQPLTGAQARMLSGWVALAGRERLGPVEA